jgi:O-antigen/teichoic acid export membrane protein
MADRAKTSAGRILHNSFWFGLETVLETIVFLGTSIAVARYLGPEKLGEFTYINFFVTTVTRTSGTGLAGATRKYMTEFLGANRPGTARAIYHLAYRYQLLASIMITALGLLSVLFFGEPLYHWMSAILILSIIPGVMSWVPAQANQAFEDVYENTLSALGYIITYAVVIVLTLHYHWDLLGIASAQLIGRTVEVTLRTVPLHLRLRKLPIDELEHEIVDRIRQFCIQAVGIQLLMSVVWDRSELLFLKHFSNLRQIAFYSVSFTLANNLLVIPRTFGSATGITLMVESAREPGRIDSIVKNACRFLLLVVFPVHLGAVAIGAQALGFAYGDKYLEAIPVVMIAAILSMPRAFQELAEVLLRAADRQRQTLIWFSITGVLNISLDWYLIPRYGAVGAAWGNGLSQTFGIIAIWRQARRFFTFGFPLQSAIRLFLAGAGMSVVAYYVVRLLPGAAGLAAALICATVTYVVLVKLFRGLNADDRPRLTMIADRMPGPLRRLYLSLIVFATPDPVLPLEREGIYPG